MTSTALGDFKNVIKSRAASGAFDLVLMPATNCDVIRSRGERADKLHSWRGHDLGDYNNAELDFALRNELGHTGAPVRSCRYASLRLSSLRP